MNTRHFLFLIVIACLPTEGQGAVPQTIPSLIKPSAEDLMRIRVFEEPLVPVRGEPAVAENVALAAALSDYSRRTTPDDFSGLIGFLERYPHSPWNAALLTGLGLEFYNTAYYSRALDAWTRAWTLARDA